MDDIEGDEEGIVDVVLDDNAIRFLDYFPNKQYKKSIFPFSPCDIKGRSPAPAPPSAAPSQPREEQARPIGQQLSQVET